MGAEEPRGHWKEDGQGLTGLTKPIRSHQGSREATPAMTPRQVTVKPWNEGGREGGPDQSRGSDEMAMFSPPFPTGELPSLPSLHFLDDLHCPSTDPPKSPPLRETG